MGRRNNKAQAALDLHGAEPIQDLIKVERNLNSLGFFIPAKKGKPTREERSRVRTIVYPAREVQGRMMRQSATIIPSPEHGLPTTADRDKYMALMKIVTDAKARFGDIQNPVAFTTYDLLKHLGHNTGGKNYEEVNQFLERMTATTIKSENAIYFHANKVYQRDIFHVFDRVVLVGQEMPDGSVAQCNYVFLSQWQLANINTNYLLRMDFNAYVSLKKDIGKALFGHLHVWFYASRCRPVERRYSELCQLLDIRRWSHLSKIRQILAPSLEELQKIRYLQEWDIVRTADGADYKLVMSPGERIMSVVRPRINGALTQGNESVAPEMTATLAEMVKRGIREADARRVLLDVPEGQHVDDQIEWFDELLRRMRTSIQNPPGFLFTMIRDGWPVPADFVTTRKRQAQARIQERKAADPEAVAEAQKALRKMQLEEQYQRYRQEETDRSIAEKFPAETLRRKLAGIRKEILAKNPDLYPNARDGWGRCPALDHHAMQALREDVAEGLDLLTFEDFCARVQQPLF
jgi:hypothetical protein